MALSRISGKEDIYIGGVFALRNPETLLTANITHILSVIKYSFDRWQGFTDKVAHLSIDVNDVDDEDLLVYMPRMVRFIEGALYPDSPALRPPGRPAEAEAIAPADAATKKLAQVSLSSSSLSSSETAAESADPKPAGVVLIHCAMGKSRSATAAIAYLLWKYPHCFGGGSPRQQSRAHRATTAGAAVAGALKWVRETRSLAEPNPGFMSQLELWWEMGCPADSDDAVERDVVYQRWLYKKEVEESARIGRAPDRLRFEDEEDGEDQSETRPGGGIVSGGRGDRTGRGGGTEAAEADDAAASPAGLELRCKKCRRVLATSRFIVPHQPNATRDHKPACPHFFVEPLSWMRPALENGALDGRLACPNAKCGASVGRFSWQGFKCNCGEWVCPAFSLQRSKIDEVAVLPHGRGGPPAGGGPDPRIAAFGIRLPPSLRGKENL